MDAFYALPDIIEDARLMREIDRDTRAHAAMVQKVCTLCCQQSTMKVQSLKCRKCNHCLNCHKDLKKGGGRHRLCPQCLTRCFDAREGRAACQACVKRNLRKLTAHLFVRDR